MNIYEFISEKFNSGEWLGYGKKCIFTELGTKSTFERRAIEDVLKRIEACGDVICVDGCYQSVEKAGLKKGVIRGNERGFAFVTDRVGENYFIPHKRLNGACNKDEVLIRPCKSERGGNDEAEVVKIIARGVTSLCGTYYPERTFGFVRPDDKNYYNDVRLPFKFCGGAKRGDKVLVELIAFPENGNPEGRVKEIIGKGGDLLAEETSIIRGYGYEEEFPATVKAEVSKTEVTDEEMQSEGFTFLDRKDFTDRTIITIDGEDSRDFDDAVEVEIADNGNYILGVHIADVSEYVERKSALDKVAYERSTSVYFPDRVIPMLPKELSDGVCSLNEGVNRKTLSCIMEITPRGEVVGRDIQKSVIKSAKRLTYTEVQAVLDGDIAVRERLKPLVPMLENMRKLQLVLSDRRAKRGNIELDVRESRIYIKDGKIAVEAQTSLDAYKIIEEFMVLCNEQVAEFISCFEFPCVYRVHEKPSKEKAEAFIDFLKLLGINVKWRADECRPSDFAAVLEKVKGEPIYPVVNKVMLRSMQKARYSDENLGHFGISSKCYCHFTSPIRRYPDLVVHRVLKDILEGNVGELYGSFVDFARDAAKISSLNERKADEAERAVDDLYKAAYMRGHVGEEFDAVISGVTSFGVFSELENGIEGLTRIEDLPRGQYVYDEKTYTLKSGKRSYTIGERVRVGVLNADISSKRIDFIILAKKDCVKPPKNLK